MCAVEWKKLGDVVNLSRGVVISKDYLRDNEGIYPVYSSQTANDGVLGRISTYNYDGEFLTWTTDGANAGTVFHRFGKFSITNVCGLIKIKDEAIISYRYLYYWLNLVAKNYVSEGMGNPKLMSNAMGNIVIPLIPITKQQEIVSHLDTFTTLISNLESELDMRRKQYEHYRNQLLDFDGVEGVEWKELGKVVKRNKGISITAGQMSELNTHNGNVRVFAAGQTIADINEDNLPANCAYNLPSIIVKSRGYIDFEFYDKPFTHKNEMWSYSFNNKDSGKLIYYYLTTKTDYFRNKAKANSVKLPQLCVADTDNYLIPIPSLAKQQEIVEKLDAFENLIQSLEQEIKLRKQQYEYYREKLLTFEKE